MATDTHSPETGPCCRTLTAQLQAAQQALSAAHREQGRLRRWCDSILTAAQTHPDVRQIILSAARAARTRH